TGNLSGLTLALGEVPRAVALGEQSVELADRSGDTRQRMINRTSWAAALHQVGRWEESATAFREAEAIQAECNPHEPWPYSIRCFQYCDLVLNRAEPEDGSGLDGISGSGTRLEVVRFPQSCREIMERESDAMRIAERDHWLLHIALDHLSLGRAHL